MVTGVCIFSSTDTRRIDVIGVSDEVCAVSDEVCVVDNDICAVPNEVCAVSNEVCLIFDEVCVVSKEVRLTVSEVVCSVSNENCTASNGVCVVANEVCAVASDEICASSNEVCLIVSEVCVVSNGFGSFSDADVIVVTFVPSTMEFVASKVDQVRLKRVDESSDESSVNELTVVEPIPDVIVVVSTSKLGVVVDAGAANVRTL